MINRLREIRRFKKKSLKTLAEEVGCGVSTINNFENGLYGLSEKLLEQIAKNLEVTPQEILKAPLDLSEPGNAREEDAPPYRAGSGGGRLIMKARQARRMVPVISWARAGGISERGFNYEDVEGQFEEMVETDTRDPNAFALVVEGDSMFPEYRAGDVVVFAPNEEARHGDIVVARLREKGTVFFKRFKRSGPEGQKVLLESVNPDYKPLEFRHEEFWFIYPAVDMVRKIRR